MSPFENLISGIAGGAASVLLLLVCLVYWLYRSEAKWELKGLSGEEIKKKFPYPGLVSYGNMILTISLLVLVLTISIPIALHDTFKQEGVNAGTEKSLIFMNATATANAAQDLSFREQLANAQATATADKNLLGDATGTIVSLKFQLSEAQKTARNLDALLKCPELSPVALGSTIPLIAKPLTKSSRACIVLIDSSKVPYYWTTTDASKAIILSPLPIGMTIVRADGYLLFSSQQAAVDKACGLLSPQEINLMNSQLPVCP